MTEYFSYKTAMKYLDFESYKSLTRLINEGLPTITVGKTKKISKSAIDKFMKDHESSKVTTKRV
ncbi:helix-turn-helix domain-containing protein [Lactobacillus crispatus]|uniref:helix-turn-helix domain-containing protein n=1 Tax=Lactobacillus crispatus TaxID=47770 RepID=UPI00123C5618|nr:helix-turn-helix domain-containing protein [Lactobacillus crispatus]KAA8809229.1 helix-turn-helix domain-containing protein [Lactobacillus crispatus]